MGTETVGQTPDSDQLYAITCTVAGEAAGAFLIASDRDEAVALARGVLPDNARVMHALQVCPASLVNMHRHKLASLIPREQRLQFSSLNLLKLITIQQGLCESLGLAVDRYEDLVHETLTQRQKGAPDARDTDA
ncbi:hypothetical protein KOR34_44860 [Posidoniimonas corsicana]|uniref:Uncharacterized protein n=1 Tax=Posidoniimonas corsicana TaxID=1938618 RepID=A0A5C5V048_9BACT|nr:hypothetical protein [Posidoniimonas corsicana]TWT31112.1 hypothetical protein KOR34_44860 [Posidoniimonas corsicana]